MKRSLLFLALGALTAAVPAGAQTIESGNYFYDLSEYTPAQNGGSFPVLSNILSNAGFETGALPPWTTSGWSVTGADFYAGAYSAESFGNVAVEQAVAPVDVNDITSITVWAKQPEGVAFAAVHFLYDDATFDEFFIAPGVDWTFVDMTSQLRGSGNLVGIRFYGYSGGGPGEDLTRIDDASIEANVGVPVGVSTWGRVKQLYR